jgi:hypothetical protein
VGAGRTPSTLYYLMNAAAGAGAYCESARAWFDLRAMAPQEVASFDPVRVLTGCYKSNRGMAGPNLLQNADFSNGLASWTTHPDAQSVIKVERDPDGRFVWHGTFLNGNWGLISQEQVLQPDTAYVYEAEVKGTSPSVSLYWQADIGRFFETNSYPDWTHLTYVFVTPHWNGQAKTTFFNPMLPKGAGDTWIKGLRLSELKPPGVQ